MYKNRLIWIDKLKGFLIILVIVGHSIANIIGNTAANNDYLWCLIYSFHMPAFIAVSGYLQYRPNSMNRQPIGPQIRRRFSQLLVPFFVWSAAYFAVRGRIESFLNCIIMPNSTFWFLWALFFICVIFAVFDELSYKLKVRHEIAMGGASVLFAFILIMLKDIHELGIQYVLYYFIFYIIGYYIHKYDLTTKRAMPLLLLSAIWFLLASYWRPHILPSFVPLTGGSATMLRFVYKFVVALVAVVAMLSIAPRIMNGNNVAGMVLTWLGKFSLGIYVIHLTFIDCLETSIRGIVCGENERIFLLCILLLAFSSVVIWLLNKNRWTARILLGKF